MGVAGYLSSDKENTDPNLRIIAGLFIINSKKCIIIKNIWNSGYAICYVHSV